jgi:CheY-like chemotaxis protein
MKILVFENEYNSVKGSFEAANLLEFNSTLEIDVVVSSQNADWNNLSNYSAIFVDIDLSSNSDMDGYSLIQKIQKGFSTIVNKIIILTGNYRIKEMLKERGISIDSVQIVNKPTNFLEIAEAIKKASVS